MGGADFVGWENYEKAIGGRKFPAIVTRTFYWMFLSVGFKMILGLIGATLLASNIRGRGLMRALVMPPWIVPIAIGCFGWLWLYNVILDCSQTLQKWLGLPMDHLVSWLTSRVLFTQQLSQMSGLERQW